MNNKTFFIVPYKEHSLNSIFLLIYSAIVIMLGSCDSFTQTDMPAAELNTAAVFEEINTANSAMSSVFAKIRDNGMLSGKQTGMSREIGLYSDELNWYGNSTQSSANFYTNTLIPTHPTLLTWWNNAYSQIYAANAVIEGVAGSKKLHQEDKDRLIGQAKFARAFIHFYLCQLWGDVPYVTRTDYKFNSTLSRLPLPELYSKIIEDLQEASSLLPEVYSDPARTLPNSYAAKALLARVYLNLGDWANAEANTTQLISNTAIYPWEEDLNEVFLKESTTTIWQYAPRSATRNTDDGTTFIFNSGPPLAVALTNDLINAFESGDKRKLKWIRSIVKGTSTWYHAYKYKKMGTNTPQTEFTIVLRLAEMYLIRAEARARQGELNTAREDLNKIRNTAGLENTTAISQEEILQAILRERRVEFFTEFAHRFMDLKRFGALDKELTEKKASWQSTDRLLPIPQRELNLNPNLEPQNTGY
ncbi:RagB/SusD family nutrient uptake outer membrane protein [Flavobacterium tructae]|uniref:RagB/SusD family nutrient uptake outer membrane protein n=1 Tax=Flavobacterium TaxID=237 RepID=UPI002224BBDD|nr:MULTISPECIES: RagB/SusD family nutrient uptake outer membrane protein [Flavobacterium]MDL2145070.1 RagB/SusD family nutrient uptake outer membrane protein [Flavobacterium tructae]